MGHAAASQGKITVVISLGTVNLAHTVVALTAPEHSLIGCLTVITLQGNHIAQKRGDLVKISRCHIIHSLLVQQLHLGSEDGCSGILDLGDRRQRGIITGSVHIDINQIAAHLVGVC